jgi:hypothetical protein
LYVNLVVVRRRRRLIFRPSLRRTKMTFEILELKLLRFQRLPSWQLGRWRPRASVLSSGVRLEKQERAAKDF